jgi:heme-degrading monooxygenase HmoA
MFVLLVELKVKAGQEQTLEKDFAGPFTAAISAQEGFLHVFLLRPNDGQDPVLVIAFENQRLQQKWVASELHGKVWLLMESHLAKFTVKTYTSV